MCPNVQMPLMSVKIFLSTVSDEFHRYRDLLRADLTRHNVEVKIQEDFKDLGSEMLDKLDVYIAHCDAVVHLVGDMSGSYPGERGLSVLLAKHPDLPTKLPPLSAALKDGVGVSYTQWEAWLALYYDKLLFIARAAETAERGPNYEPTDDSRTAQATHLARLKEIGRYPGCTFTSADSLVKYVLGGGILDLLTKEALAESITSPRPHLVFSVERPIVNGILADRKATYQLLVLVLENKGAGIAEHTQFVLAIWDEEGCIDFKADATKSKKSLGHQILPGDNTQLEIFFGILKKYSVDVVTGTDLFGIEFLIDRKLYLKVYAQYKSEDLKSVYLTEVNEIEFYWWRENILSNDIRLHISSHKPFTPSPDYKLD
jgi:hypothetical protein